MSSPIEPTDQQIEAVAQAIHAGYLRDHVANGGDPDHEAAAPWDDLPRHLQAQNRRQARTNLRRAAQVGLRLVPIDEAGPDRIIELAPEQVEVLAQLEHDDWTLQKRSQGYRWGAERVSAGPVKTHPDLLDWDDLGEEAREKDRAPMRRLPVQLELVGLAIVPA